MGSNFSNVVTSYFFTGIKPQHPQRQIAQQSYQDLSKWSNLRPKEINSQKKKRKKKGSLKAIYS